MKSVASFLLLFVFTTVANSLDCGGGSWTPYKDEYCLQIFPSTFKNYTEAKEFCISQASTVNRPSLVQIPFEDFQKHLADSLYADGDFLDDIWLGAAFSEDTQDFLWEDGSKLTYTNWAPGYPRDSEDVDRCVVMRPPGAFSKDGLDAKWIDVPCRQNKAIVCQKQPSWSIDEVIAELIKLRQQPFPIGFMYVEFPFNANPRTLWPTMKWEDVSHLFPGHFFRVAGGSAGPWGESQGGCAPRLDAARYGGYANPENWFPADGWSVGVKTGDWSSGMDHGPLATSFHTTGCEVRPVNMPMRIWKVVE